MPPDGRIGLGLLGCGGFGEFCLRAFSRMAGVRIAAVADVRREAADRLAGEFGVDAVYDPAAMMARRDVDLVHIATPPATHHPLVLDAAKAGKHCLCEKPLALRAAEARQMLAAMQKAQRIAPVNFVLRHNEATEAVKRVIDSGAIGGVLSARLTNCASDSRLDPGHWFWDKRTSGGIFIEHGVHFFDLYKYWLGDGRVISAHAEIRAGTRQEDRVTCEVRHENGAIASHYHGFDQVAPMDRTDHRLVCELGDIRVDGWIPLRVVVEAALDAAGLERLLDCLPGASVRVVEEFGPDAGPTPGRGKDRKLEKRVRLEFAPHPDKQAVYAQSVRALLADQIAFLRDRSHPRRVTERNGLDSLCLAEAAADLAAG